MGDPQAGYWRRLVDRAMAFRPHPMAAVEYRAATRHGKSRPVVLLCTNDDQEEEFVVKGMGEIIHPHGHIHPKALFNDQVVGRLGLALGAPIPRVELIDVPDSLIGMNWSMAHLLAGIAHGSRFVPNVTDVETILHCDQSENRQRFALLSVLFGWMQVDEDLQFVYSRSDPMLVYSVDHGDMFPNGPTWNVHDLNAARTPRPFSLITTACGLGSDSLSQAVQALSRIDDVTIATAVATPPEAWHVSNEERVALCQYLARRRDQLLATIPPTQ